MERQTPEKDNKRQSIARGAVTVMGAFIVSNLVGLLAKTLTARYFGTGIESNAFFAANRFSEILFNLVAGGALGSAFIPVFTGLLVNEEKRRAWHLASALVNIVSLVLVGLSLLTLLFSRTVVRTILAPGFSPSEIALTARLLRIQVLSSIIFGLSGLVMGILNAHQRFLLPSLAPAMYQVGWLIGIFALRPALGVDGLAWGVVIRSLPVFFGKRRSRGEGSRSADGAAPARCRCCTAKLFAEYLPGILSAAGFHHCAQSCLSADDHA